MYHFLRYRVGVQGKIGVYGRSIGCTAASHISPWADMCILDRGFSDFWTLAENKFYGKFAKFFFKYFTQGWQANNSFNVLKMSPKKCFKVILQDRSDEIVDLWSSLHVGVAREYKALEGEPYLLDDLDIQLFMKEYMSILEAEDALERIINDLPVSSKILATDKSASNRDPQVYISARDERSGIDEMVIKKSMTMVNEPTIIKDSLNFSIKRNLDGEHLIDGESTLKDCKVADLNSLLHQQKQEPLPRSSIKRLKSLKIGATNKEDIELLQILL